MAKSTGRRAVGCLGMLCLPVAVVLTLVWMSNHKDVGYYVGAGGFALLGCLLMLIWLGWVAKNWSDARARRVADAQAQAGKLHGSDVCQVCHVARADFFCKPPGGLVFEKSLGR